MDNADFEWDETKNRTNLKKHGVDFDYAMRVFSDPFMVLFQSGYEDDEERWRAYGLVGGRALVMVAHTYRNQSGQEKVRIISARMATRQERNDYERTNGQ